jgi:hypothetical protein
MCTLPSPRASCKQRGMCTLPLPQDLLTVVSPAGGKGLVALRSAFLTPGHWLHKRAQQTVHRHTHRRSTYQDISLEGAASRLQVGPCLPPPPLGSCLVGAPAPRGAPRTCAGTCHPTRFLMNLTIQSPCSDVSHLIPFRKFNQGPSSDMPHYLMYG